MDSIRLSPTRRRRKAMLTNRKYLTAIATIAVGLTIVSSQAIAQQKTVRECRDEWRANKAANQANGITEKAYVAQCRSEGATNQPAATSPAPPPPSTNTAAQGGKTAKECRAEWRANKAANQANGVTEKAYVAQCRAGVATTTPPTPAAPPPSAAAPETSPTTAGPKTAKACREEWRANKAANQANGITEKAYVEKCRSGTAAAQPAPSPAAPPVSQTPPSQRMPSPTAATPPPAPAPARPERPVPSATSTNLEGNEFSTEALAKSHCPTDTVVWANLKSHVYHFSDTRFYGNTENGAYMCEREATSAGMRAAKNETHP
jgi:hypothetical protein